MRIPPSENSQSTNGARGSAGTRGNTPALPLQQGHSAQGSGSIEPMETKKILVISALGWPFVARVPLELAKLGLQVGIVAPPRSLIRKLTSLHAHFDYSSLAPQSSIQRAIETWSPDFLICSDDQAVTNLIQIYRRASQAGDSPRMRRLVNLIECSLGNADCFSTALVMSAFVSLAQSLGVRCPKTNVVDSNQALVARLHDINYPILLKADGSHGGRGVRFVGSESEVLPAASELLLPITWPAPLKSAMAGRVLFSLFGRYFRWPRNVCLQEHILGRPANRALVCWKGNVLAGISVEVLQTSYEFGPASVVKTIDHPEMRRAAETMVKHLGLSGFVGFDFVLDCENRAWLLEINARVTPIAHFNVDQGNLSTAMFEQLTGTKPLEEPRRIRETTIALFPQELARSACSDYLPSSYHDVPWDEPQFVMHCLDWALRRGFVNRIRKTQATSRDLQLKKRMHATSCDRSSAGNVRTPSGRRRLR